MKRERDLGERKGEVGSTRKTREGERDMNVKMKKKKGGGVT